MLSSNKMTSEGIPTEEDLGFETDSCTANVGDGIYPAAVNRLQSQDDPEARPDSDGVHADLSEESLDEQSMKDEANNVAFSVAEPHSDVRGETLGSEVELMQMKMQYILDLRRRKKFRFATRGRPSRSGILKSFAKLFLPDVILAQTNVIGGKHIMKNRFSVFPGKRGRQTAQAQKDCTPNVEHGCNYLLSENSPSCDTITTHRPSNVVIAEQPANQPLSAAQHIASKVNVNSMPPDFAQDVIRTERVRPCNLVGEVSPGDRTPAASVDEDIRVCHTKAGSSSPSGMKKPEMNMRKEKLNHKETKIAQMRHGKMSQTLRCSIARAHRSKSVGDDSQNADSLRLDDPRETNHFNPLRPKRCSSVTNVRQAAAQSEEVGNRSSFDGSKVTIPRPQSAFPDKRPLELQSAWPGQTAAFTSESQDEVSTTITRTTRWPVGSSSPKTPQGKNPHFSYPLLLESELYGASLGIDSLAPDMNSCQNIGVVNKWERYALRHENVCPTLGVSNPIGKMFASKLCCEYKHTCEKRHTDSRDLSIESTSRRSKAFADGSYDHDADVCSWKTESSSSILLDTRDVISDIVESVAVCVSRQTSTHCRNEIDSELHGKVSASMAIGKRRTHDACLMQTAEPDMGCLSGGPDKKREEQMENDTSSFDMTRTCVKSCPSANIPDSSHIGRTQDGVERTSQTASPLIEAKHTFAASQDVGCLMKENVPSSRSQETTVLASTRSNSAIPCIGESDEISQLKSIHPASRNNMWSHKKHHAFKRTTFWGTRKIKVSARKPVAQALFANGYKSPTKTDFVDTQQPNSGPCNEDDDCKHLKGVAPESQGEVRSNDMSVGAASGKSEDIVTGLNGIESDERLSQDLGPSFNWLEHKIMELHHRSQEDYTRRNQDNLAQNSKQAQEMGSKADTAKDTPTSDHEEDNGHVTEEDLSQAKKKDDRSRSDLHSYYTTGTADQRAVIRSSDDNAPTQMDSSRPGANALGSFDGELRQLQNDIFRRPFETTAGETDMGQPGQTVQPLIRKSNALNEDGPAEKDDNKHTIVSETYRQPSLERQPYPPWINHHHAPSKTEPRVRGTEKSNVIHHTAKHVTSSLNIEESHSRMAHMAHMAGKTGNTFDNMGTTTAGVETPASTASTRTCRKENNENNTPSAQKTSTPGHKSYFSVERLVGTPADTVQMDSSTHTTVPHKEDETDEKDSNYNIFSINIKPVINIFQNSHLAGTKHHRTTSSANHVSNQSPQHSPTKITYSSFPPRAHTRETSAKVIVKTEPPFAHSKPVDYGAYTNMTLSFVLQDRTKKVHHRKRKNDTSSSSRDTSADGPSQAKSSAHEGVVVADGDKCQVTVKLKSRKDSFCEEIHPVDLSQKSHRHTKSHSKVGIISEELKAKSIQMEQYHSYRFGHGEGSVPFGANVDTESSTTCGPFLDKRVAHESSNRKEQKLNLKTKMALSPKEMVINGRDFYRAKVKHHNSPTETRRTTGDDSYHKLAGKPYSSDSHTQSYFTRPSSQLDPIRDVHGEFPGLDNNRRIPSSAQKSAVNSGISQSEIGYKEREHYDMHSPDYFCDTQRPTLSLHGHTDNDKMCLNVAKGSFLCPEKDGLSKGEIDALYLSRYAKKCPESRADRSPRNKMSPLFGSSEAPLVRNKSRSKEESHHKDTYSQTEQRTVIQRNDKSLANNTECNGRQTSKPHLSSFRHPPECFPYRGLGLIPPVSYMPQPLSVVPDEFTRGISYLHDLPPTWKYPQTLAQPHPSTGSSLQHALSLHTDQHAYKDDASNRSPHSHIASYPYSDQRRPPPLKHTALANSSMLLPGEDLNRKSSIDGLMSLDLFPPKTVTSALGYEDILQKDSYGMLQAEEKQPILESQSRRAVKERSRGIITSSDLQGTIRCDACTKAASLLCSGCHRVAYCSEICQFMAWSKHRASCKGNSVHS